VALGLSALTALAALLSFLSLFFRDKGRAIAVAMAAAKTKAKPRPIHNFQRMGREVAWLSVCFCSLESGEASGTSMLSTLALIFDFVVCFICFVFSIVVDLIL